MTTTTATLAALRSGELKGITRLDLTCDLQEFPREFLQVTGEIQPRDPLQLTGAQGGKSSGGRRHGLNGRAIHRSRTKLGAS
jgi:hypothetical protein